MHCSEFEARLTHAVEARDSAELARLSEHLEACAAPECRALWSEQEWLARAIAEWRSQRPPAPRLVERVLKDLMRPCVDRSVANVAAPLTKRRASGWGAVVTAAALLLAVGLMLRPTSHTASLARRTSTPSSLGTDVVPSSPSTLASSGDSPSAPVAIEPARESYVDLAHEATYFVTDLAMLVVPVDVAAEDDMSPEEASWFNRLGEQLEPVKTGVEGKLGEWFGAPAT
jgi:hypothetical protein